MGRMDLLKIFLYVLGIINAVSSVNGSFCSKANRTQNLAKCLEKTREIMLEPNKFWFGNQYANQCPLGEDSGVFCRNPKPTMTSIHQRLFPALEHTDGLDRFLELEFHSEGKNYEACGNKFRTTESWKYDVDPTSDTVVYPWYVKNFPISVNWNYTAGEYYTLMVYDAGYLTCNGLYINIPQDDFQSAEVIRHYGQPLIGTNIKNPYLFLLFKQNDEITLSDDWKNKIRQENTAGAWTIEEFTTAVNMSGLVAVNLIVVTGDEWIAQTMMDRGGPYALCPLYATEALHKKPRTFIPNDAQLSVWIDFDFMNPSSHTITACCKETTYPARNFTLNPLGTDVLNTWDVRTDAPHTLKFTKLGYYSQRHNFTGDMHTVISVDPDVPIPAFGTEELPILHGIVTNIVDGNLKGGEEGLTWTGPRPPNDVPHYYYTLLYKQQAEINATELRYKYAGNCSGRLEGRCLYDISRAVSENNLTLVGATWFLAQKDAYVLQRLAETPGSNEAEVCKGQPGYSNPCTTDSSTAVFPSIISVCILFLLSLLTF
ncbi:uncharacterized protein C56G2.4-like isoform X2 [Mercenaria mercenaria]|uniref:uncharacterized protein C56G2.4-like isoform X2 n=1 Tax=Mercenaria mercenaria TaxID=6596 RepID=UPI00234ECBCD|nr:uncharacterized protein C56G2.4-like isoform X2 [Mercenaria mercenaria]